jgi:predicted MFS family arabinose efflux permease
VLFVGLLAIAGALWILAALIFSRLEEYSGATEGGGNAIAEALRQMHLIRVDRDLRQFLVVRTLLLSTALVAPFYVGIASEHSGGALTQFGAMLIATGAASFLSAPVWGRLADRSSRQVMAAAALLAAVSGVVTAGLAHTPELPYPAVAFSSTYFLLNIAHAGVRVGRKTHLVDIATTDNRASYVAVSNTFIGAMLIAGSAFGGIASLAGPTAVILLLSAISLVAAGAAWRLEEAQ